MTQDSAKAVVTPVVDGAYDEAAFRRLVGNLVGDDALRDEPVQHGAYVYEAFRDHVKSFKRIAKAEDADGAEMDVLAVELASGASLDRARTMQRNFVATYLGRKEREAALVAFHAPDRDDWRLSLVRLDYRSEVTESGKVKAVKELTPARRYSFLVGPDEPSHTAEQRLVEVLTGGGQVTVEALEAAFRVEKVTKAFFNDYNERFFDLRDAVGDALVRDPAVRADFARAGLSEAGFAKKLLGQIVFLYFIQKKGWLGVPAGARWGDGPKDFLRRLLDGTYGAHASFFDDALEPLFYEALATERGADGYYSRFGCRIPFLNGGLFEPPGGYDWSGLRLGLPDTLFRDILDTFDTYNFTVREDEPLEKEVAVDPEMLGNVFEKLLEVKDRKAKGAFYTPREIVAYMADRSLVGYLDNALNGDGAGDRRKASRPLATPDAPTADLFRGAPPVQMALAETAPAPRVPEADLDALVRHGERWAENDRHVVENDGHETETYRWQAPRAVRDHARALDDALAAVTVCDPAIGSGAFPVGMMQAIVRVREALTTYVDPRGGEDRSAYAFKRHAIGHSLYGTDIEPSAVDIAQLRLWLSLVVDEDDVHDVQPLPNLRYKVVLGDALGGLRQSVGLDVAAAYDTLQTRLATYVAENSPVRKAAMQAEIDGLIAAVGGGTFDYRVVFGEVFAARGGFDIVIGNPPYVRQESLTAEQKARYRQFETFAGTADLLVYFIERGMQLLRPGGVFAYIVANKWMRAGYGKPLRRWLTGAAAGGRAPRRIVEVMDFGDLPVFDGATTYPSILRLEKGPGAPDFRAVNVATLAFGDLAAYAEREAFRVPVSSLDDAGWALVDGATRSLLQKLQRAGRPLGEVLAGEIYRGVLTGYNEAFVIDAATRARLIAEDAKSADLIKPFLAGREVKRYRPPAATSYLIFTRRGVEIEKYPAIKRHLLQYRKQLEPKPKGWKPTKPGETWPGRKGGAYKWYEVQDSVAYYAKFEQPKIIIPNFAIRGGYTFDLKGNYSNDKTAIIPVNSPFLLGLLNSMVLDLVIAETASTKQGGYFEYKPVYVSALPIVEVGDDPKRLAAKAEIETHVLELLRLGTGTPAEVASRADAIRGREAEVDRLVADLYGLTPEEVALVAARVGGERA